MATFAPNVIDKINPDKAADIIGDVIGVTPQIIRDDDETKAIRDARAEKNAKLQQLEMLKLGADAVKTGAEAEKTMAESQNVGSK